MQILFYKYIFTIQAKYIQGIFSIESGLFSQRTSDRRHDAI